jgi:hypothetical protein
MDGAIFEEHQQQTTAGNRHEDEQSGHHPRKRLGIGPIAHTDR